MVRIVEVFIDGYLGHIYEPEEVQSGGWDKLVGKSFAAPLLGYFACPPEAGQDWTYEDGQFLPPPPPEPPTLKELKSIKHAEISAAADIAGKAGAVLMGYHMVLLPEDVAYLQQANSVAHIEAQMMDLPVDAPIAAIKEKWYEDGGAIRTVLHEAVPLNIHDVVLAYAAMQAAEIIARKERLMQAISAAESPEAVSAIIWAASQSAP